MGRIWECEFNERCNDELVNSFGSVSSSVQHDSSNSLEVEEDGTSAATGVGRTSIPNESRPGVPVRQINTYKDDANLKDQQSTGRKRAAEMYPLNREADCEWARQSNCGGNKPIVGCVDGKQEARHHGPDKNTLNNDSGNVHRICHNCHNRWHATNDETYVWGSNYPPHDPCDASIEELADNILRWSKVTIKKVKD
jgi:hypothetical protein